jgi:hypothetical protein
VAGVKTTLAILLALCLGMSAVGDERPECEIMQLEKKNFEKTKTKAGKGDAERTSSILSSCARQMRASSFSENYCHARFT